MEAAAREPCIRLIVVLDCTRILCREVRDLCRCIEGIQTDLSAKPDGHGELVRCEREFRLRSVRKRPRYGRRVGVHVRRAVVLLLDGHGDRLMTVEVRKSRCRQLILVPCARRAPLCAVHRSVDVSLRENGEGRIAAHVPLDAYDDVVARVLRPRDNAEPDLGGVARRRFMKRCAHRVIGRRIGIVVAHRPSAEKDIGGRRHDILAERPACGKGVPALLRRREVLRLRRLLLRAALFLCGRCSEQRARREKRCEERRAQQTDREYFVLCSHDFSSPNIILHLRYRPSRMRRAACEAVPDSAKRVRKRPHSRRCRAYSRSAGY